MLIWALLFLLGTGDTEDRIQSIIVDLLHPGSLEQVEIDTVQQSYFEDLTFLEIDTGVVYRDSDGSYYVHPIYPFKPIRIAVDADGRVYKLFGFDTLDFEKLIYRYPPAGISLDVSSLYDYGRFFIEITIISRLDGNHHFVEGTNWFVELNRKMMIDDFTRFISKRLQELEERMKELSPVLNFDTLKFDRRTNNFIVDYYIWFESNGDFRHVSLRIELDGACYVLKDEVLAQQLGAYEAIRRAIFPPREN